MYTFNIFTNIWQGIIDLYIAIKDFLVECWNAYFNFVTNLFGKDFAIGFTIVIIFVIVALVFLGIIKESGTPNK